MPFRKQTRFKIEHLGHLRRCFILAVFLMGLTITRSLSAQDLTPSDAKTLAAEAYIYGYPLVENYKTMYAYAINKGGDQYKAPFNTLKNEANVFTPADTAVVTPNSDTPYSFLWMDLRTQPLVLVVPEIDDDRYYSIQLVDLYTFNFAYIGTRATGNGAGSYLIAGPSWQGEKPDGVDKVIRCETNFALAIYRTQLFRPDDLQNVQHIQRQYTVQTLSDFLGDPAPKPAPAIEFPPPDPESSDTLAFFDQLNFLLQFCPTHPTETELMARLAKIGIGGGKSFDASTFSEEIQAAMRSGMADGRTAIASAPVKTVAPPSSSPTTPVS